MILANATPAETFMQTADHAGVIALLLLGSCFCLLAAVGLIRMPDLYTRMQASTKGGTLGVGCLVLAVALKNQDLLTAAQALLVTAFVFLTAPVSSHLLGRAAYFVGVKKWHQNAFDELEGCYDPETHALSAKPDAENAAYAEVVRERVQKELGEGVAIED